MPTWEQEADALHASGARHVLILSGSNSARGQLAEGIARALAPRQVRITSAGATRGAVDPLAVRVLAELSVNIADQRSRSLDEVGDLGDVQAVLVLSDDDPTPASLRGVLRVHWPLPDPAAGGGRDEERLARYRAARNELRRRLIRVFAHDVAAAAPGAAPATIEPAAGGDLDALKPLLQESLLPSRDVGGRGQRFVVAREGGHILGCAGLEVYGEDGQVRSLAVHWTRRNAGLGSRLHERLLHEATLAGVRRLWVTTATAEDFFARHGYRRVRIEDVPAPIRASEEFVTLAPASGAVMSRPVVLG